MFPNGKGSRICVLFDERLGDNVETFEWCPGHVIQLQRLPLRSRETLRPWDAADAYILSQCHEQGLLQGAPRILIVNDSFGALGTALSAFKPDSWGDSLVAHQSLVHNLELNNLDGSAVPFIPADVQPEGLYDLVLLKMPKSMAFWADLLHGLRPLIKENTHVISGGMIKHTPKRAFELLEKTIGETKTSLGWKKARLAFSTLDASLPVLSRPVKEAYTVEGNGLEMADWPNLFSFGRLDEGTALLMRHLPETQRLLHIADLGCGNGILALAAARRCPKAQVLGVDVSFQAVACARENAERNGLGDQERIRFKVMESLSEVERDSLDYVLCNPPFHQVQVIGDLIAWRMFQQARKTLKTGGEFRVVGNRHLGYHIKLKRIFGHCEVLASSSKFVVLKAKKI